MAFELLANLASLSIIDMNEGIVAARNNLVLVELETRNHVTRVSCKCDMTGLDLAIGPTLADHVVTTVK
jgi:hypothetical protein